MTSPHEIKFMGWGTSITNCGAGGLLASVVEEEERRKREQELSESVTSVAAHDKNDGEPPLLPPQVQTPTNCALVLPCASSKSSQGKAVGRNKMLKEAHDCDPACSI